MMHEEVCKEDMPERDAYVAQQLVNKGMCARTQREGKTYFKQANYEFLNEQSLTLKP